MHLAQHHLLSIVGPQSAHIRRSQWQRLLLDPDGADVTLHNLAEQFHNFAVASSSVRASIALASACSGQQG